MSSDLNDEFFGDDDVEFRQLIDDTGNEDKAEMTSWEKKRMAENRSKALALKKARLNTANISNIASSVSGTAEKFLPEEEADKKKRKLREQPKKDIDTGAGFFITPEEEDLGVPGNQPPDKKLNLSTEDVPILKPDQPVCQECGENFAVSYLYSKFGYYGCDGCRDTEKEGKHELITKTEAKNIFLLRDYDLDQREPPLKFIIRKNPHNERWGEMKLFLRSQIEKRALEVWGSEEALEKEIENKNQRKELAKKKKFDKTTKALRMKVRGSLFSQKDYAQMNHKHSYDDNDEKYDQETDTYSKKCRECDYVHSYEKM